MKFLTYFIVFIWTLKSYRKNIVDFSGRYYKDNVVTHGLCFDVFVFVVNTDFSL